MTETIPKLREQIEERRFMEQMEAGIMKKNGQNHHSKRDTTTNNKAAGVAVIKTIAKQTRRTSKNPPKHEKNTTNEDDVPLLEDQIAQLEEQARQYMEDAAMLHNYPDALVSLGNHALVNEDVHTAMEYYQKADSGEGWFNMGHLLWAGYANIVDANEVEAMRAMKKAMSHGDVDAMYFVGVHLIQDVNDEKEEEWWEVFDLHDGSSSEKVIQAIGTAVSHTERKKQGLHLITLAGTMGHGEALHFLALLHRNGEKELGIQPYTEEITTGDDERNRFMIYLEEAVLAESSDALNVRAHCQLQGEDGYEKNAKLALQDFLAAAELDHADACVSAGAMLHQGYGGVVERDQERAFELYQKAGELGSIEGWRNVVACYATGQGVPENKQVAEYIAKTMLFNKESEEDVG
eukprot:CAMPEP_0196826704 /NCGR_PEP_ID=MMETSP1362-20130617/93765_1 /TAXON_ID=163516 /ORGANISM="Leptocylindrus danicus, Strain CCMP1856" /LENGTH=405 /DNA_ID=CAMNT_0042207291 /DNA_START=381 /DNA_END=1598 /DNA_ORIENTATION=-